MDDEEKARWFADEVARTFAQQQQAQQRPEPVRQPEPVVIHKTTHDALIQRPSGSSPTRDWQRWILTAADKAVEGYAAAAEEAIARFVISREKVLLKKIATLESRLATLERARVPERSASSPALRVVKGSGRAKP